MMSDVYLIEDTGRTSRMEPIRHNSDEKELKELLLQNPELLPGDRIQPDDPRRWAVIGKSIPPQPGDPVGNGNRSDLLMLDQDGIPTIVRCKQFTNADERHTAIGQLLELASDAQSHWAREGLAKAAREEEPDMKHGIKSLLLEDSRSIEAYLDTVEENVRKGRIRMIVFTEQCPAELRRLVEFLNHQLENSEVLLIEAKQYRRNGFRIVVPSVFGYASPRRLSRKVAGQSQDFLETDKKWNKDSFFEEAKSQTTVEQLKAIKTMYQAVERLPLDLKWGSGSGAGCFEVTLPKVASAPLMSIASDGELVLKFGSLTGSHRAESFQQKFRSIAHSRLGRAFDREHESHTLPPEEWCPKATAMVHVLDDLVTASS